MNPNVLNKPLLATAQQLEEAFYVEMMASMLPVDLPVIPGVVIIPVEGLLLQRFEGFGSSYERIYGQIKKALNTPDIKHIVLDINSGGGEVNGLFDLVDFIREARNQKPITALINEQAYSAAYLIATSASQIVIPRTGSVGSIGVMVAHLDQSEAEKQQGLTYTEIFAGKHKLDFSPHQPLTDAAKTELQAHVDETYALLIQTLSLRVPQPARKKLPRPDRARTCKCVGLCLELSWDDLTG
jgi:ClpP class serine protease